MSVLLRIVANRSCKNLFRPAQEFRKCQEVSEYAAGVSCTVPSGESPNFQWIPS